MAHRGVPDLDATVSFREPPLQPSLGGKRSKKTLPVYSSLFGHIVLLGNVIPRSISFTVVRVLLMYALLTGVNPLPNFLLLSSVLSAQQDMAKRAKSASMTLKDFYEKAPGQAPFENRLPSKPGMSKTGCASRKDIN